VRFLREWVLALVAGDSLTGTLLKLGTIGLGAIGASVLDQPLGVYVWFDLWVPGRWYQLTLGWAAFSVIAAFYVAWVGGASWARSRGPRLDTAGELIPDGTYQIFRLRVRNGGAGLLVPNAALVWVRDDDGPCQEEILPLNLAWSHLPVGARPQLSWDESATVGVAYVVNRHTVTWRLRFAGEFHEPEEFLQPAQAHSRCIELCVRVTVPGTTKFQERAFRLEPEDTRPLGFRVVRLASQESSRRRAFRMVGPLH
jgi:hypothetical protein